jgi:hypothetical protein
MAIRSSYPQPKNLGHLMLDLETMGNASNSAIVSIGAVEFDINTGETGREFYELVSLQSCLDKGLIINASTVYWWLEQNEAARKQICKPSDNLYNVLVKLKSFMACLGDFQIWGNSARFDIGILESAYRAFGHESLTLPWKFRDERDVRTLVSFAPSVKESLPFTGVQHSPIDDCKHQIKYCSEIWRKLHSNL